MRNFAGEAGVPTWVFVIAPALLSMLFALLLYRKAVSNVSGIKQSLSRALLVAMLTWLALVSASALFGALGIAHWVARATSPSSSLRSAAVRCCLRR